MNTPSRKLRATKGGQTGVWGRVCFMGAHQTHLLLYYYYSVKKKRKETKRKSDERRVTVGIDEFKTIFLLCTAQHRLDMSNTHTHSSSSLAYVRTQTCPAPTITCHLSLSLVLTMQMQCHSLICYVFNPHNRSQIKHPFLNL